MFCQRIFAAILFFAVLSEGIIYNKNFDWDICKYNKKDRHEIYSEYEIRDHCDRFYKEKLHRYRRNIDRSKYSIDDSDINNINMLLNGFNSTGRTKRSTKDLKSSKDLFESCHKVAFKVEECGHVARRTLLNELITNGVDLRSKDELINMLDIIKFIDFSIFFGERGSTSPAEVKRILDFLITVDWGIFPGDAREFQNLLWRVTGIFDITLYNHELSSHILMAHEHIFSHILFWKLHEPDYVFKLFYTFFEELNHEDHVLRICNMVLQMYTLVEHNKYWNKGLETFKIINYVNFIQKLDPSYHYLFDNKFTYLTQNDVLPYNQTIYLEQTRVVVKYADKDKFHMIQKELTETYYKFKNFFNGYLNMSVPEEQYIGMYVFGNRTQYERYGKLFGITVNNGGITFSNYNKSKSYCYGEKGEYKNLGHELVHSLLHTYYVDRKADIPYVLNEGLADYLGQVKYYTRDIDIISIFKNHTITFDDILHCDYHSRISPYSFGFLVIKALVDTNQKDILIRTMLTFTKNSQLYESLMTRNIPTFEITAQKYIEEYKEHEYLIKQERNKNRHQIAAEVFRKYYPGDGINITMDNTVFFIDQNQIVLSYTQRNWDDRREILNDASRYADLDYLLRFTVDISLKEAPGYEIMYPSIVQKKEVILLEKNGKPVTDADEKERIFNCFYKMKEELNLPVVPVESTFTEIKKIAAITSKLHNVTYYKLFTPNVEQEPYMQKLIHMINTDIRVDLDLIRDVDSNLIVDIKNHTIIDIFKGFFPTEYYLDDTIDFVVRYSGYDYLRKNVALSKQYYVKHRNERFKSTRKLKKKTKYTSKQVTERPYIQNITEPTTQVTYITTTQPTVTTPEIVTRPIVNYYNNDEYIKRISKLELMVKELVASNDYLKRGIVEALNKIEITKREQTEILNEERDLLLQILDKINLNFEYGQIRESGEFGQRDRNSYLEPGIIKEYSPLDAISTRDVDFTDYNERDSTTESNKPLFKKNYILILFIFLSSFILFSYYFCRLYKFKKNKNKILI